MAGSRGDARSRSGGASRANLLRGESGSARAVGTGPERTRRSISGPGTFSRRRPLAAAASLLLVIVCALIGAVAYESAGRRVGALALSRPVAAGEVITASMLRVVRVTPQRSIAMIPAAMAKRIIGRPASESLSAGTLLTSADVGGRNAVPPGDAVVGLAVKEGQMPAGGVRPGSEVMVVFTGPAGQALQTAPSVGGSASGGTAGSPASDQGSGFGAWPGSAQAATAVSGSPGAPGTVGPGGVLVAAALVTAVEPPRTAGSSVLAEVSIEVPEAVAGSVTAAASAGQVSLAVVPAAGT